MTATAKLADYLIPPKLVLEAPAYTNLQDFIGDLACQGYADSHAQYAPAVVDPPAGSDALEEWEFLARLATAMGRTMRISRIELDGAALPSSDEVLAALVRKRPRSARRGEAASARRAVRRRVDQGRGRRSRRRRSPRTGQRADDGAAAPSCRVGSRASRRSRAALPAHLAAPAARPELDAARATR